MVPHHGWGMLPGLFIGFHLVGALLLLALVVALILGGRRRARRLAAAGFGPWSHWRGASAAESVLAERFARGDIDEQEYRARLEVLRATPPWPGATGTPTP